MRRWKNLPSQPSRLSRKNPLLVWSANFPTIRPVLTRFFDPNVPSLKICGVVNPADAQMLVAENVDAMGVNFWPLSKRFVAPGEAAGFLAAVAGRILRVGVFVNADPQLPLQLFADGLIDLAQFHGDESPAYCGAMLANRLPFIKALPALPAALAEAHLYGAQGILIDTPAPGSYGGTGEAFDWSIAANFIKNHPDIPVILAGGITPANAAQAIAAVCPAAIDVASGAESSPAKKDRLKVSQLRLCLHPKLQA